MVKAVALFSGGLDSALAILTILKQGIDVKALSFLTPFNTSISGKSLHVSNGGSFSNKFGFDVQIRHLEETFIDMVKNPKFGYGKNMNPCIDCRILMLKEAKLLMDETGADFIITGEVLGQRPMSQRRDTLNRVDREAGVKGYVLRPLSAKLLDVTIPEAGGIVSRDVLHDFSGRSRKPQIDLAREFRLMHYPAPAGGCLLTEPIFSHKLKDLLAHNQKPIVRDITLLKVGRHFRFSPECKIIVGRDKKENEILESLAGNSDCLITIEGYGSPTTLVSGAMNEEALRVAASLCARYSDAKELPHMQARVVTQKSTYSIRISRASNEIVEALRIERTQGKNIIKA
jgi:tRNA U34 2-thiouridine synthase MnmA/TrmU